MANDTSNVGRLLIEAWKGICTSTNLHDANRSIELFISMWQNSDWGGEKCALCQHIITTHLIPDEATRLGREILAEVDAT